MFAKNYRKRSIFEKVMVKIKRCSFFAPQCRESKQLSIVFTIQSNHSLQFVTPVINGFVNDLLVKIFIAGVYSVFETVQDGNRVQDMLCCRAPHNSVTAFKPIQLTYSKLIAFLRVANSNKLCFCLKESWNINVGLGVWFLLDLPVHLKRKLIVFNNKHLITIICHKREKVPN